MTHKQAPDRRCANRSGQPPLDWLIIGGGVHGVHLAARLIGEADVDSERLAIVDPTDSLLSRWRTCTGATGMQYLRSPSIHNLDLSPWSLSRFAGGRRRRKPGLFRAPYDRPSLSLFDAHCDHVVESFGLRDLHIKDRASRCRAEADGVRVELVSGEQLCAKRIVLAVGNDTLAWPRWAPRAHPAVRHVFQTTSAQPPSDAVIAVVGGGISAAQLALRMAAEQRPVHLICRHPLRRHQFDSDPGWLGPKRMTGFLRERDLGRRRSLITIARHRGSVPPDVFRQLKTAFRRTTIIWHQSRVEAALPTSDGVQLRLVDGSSLAADRVVLATGASAKRPGGSLVSELIDSLHLKTASCGYPIIDRALRWHPRIHVTGALAELELGPTARNIAGARRAGERMVAMSRAQKGTR